MIRQPPDTESAQNIAVTALAWLANDEILMRRFLDMSGIEASQIRAAAAEPGFMAGVLRFIAAHEPTLNAFASAENLHPASVLSAMRALPGGNDDWMGST